MNITALNSLSFGNLNKVYYHNNSKQKTQPDCTLSKDVADTFVHAPFITELPQDFDLHIYPINIDPYAKSATYKVAAFTNGVEQVGFELNNLQFPKTLDNIGQSLSDPAVNVNITNMIDSSSSENIQKNLEIAEQKIQRMKQENPNMFADANTRIYPCITKTKMQINPDVTAYADTVKIAVDTLIPNQKYGTLTNTQYVDIDR